MTKLEENNLLTQIAMLESIVKNQSGIISIFENEIQSAHRSLMTREDNVALPENYPIMSLKKSSYDNIYNVLSSLRSDMYYENLKSNNLNDYVNEIKIKRDVLQQLQKQ